MTDMFRLLKKELTLNNLPIIWVAPLLTILVAIPYYPASISICYGLLSLFLLLNFAKENRDTEYTLTMPLRRKDIVLSKISLGVLIELMQVVFAAVFALIRIFALTEKEFSASMLPNFALFGFMLASFAAFNLVFYVRYFSSGGKTGLAGIFGFLTLALCVSAVEVSAAYAPYMAILNKTGDGISLRLIVFFAGVIIYVGGLVVTYLISVKKFEKAKI